MDLLKDKYVIVEIIPTHSKSEKGIIAQLSALKLQGLKLLERFDYRVEDRFIENEDLKNMIQYDKNQFTYVNNVYFILEKFKHWVKDLPLVLIDDTYTLDYLKELNNKKELVYPYLDIENSSNSFIEMIEKYELKPSNYIVDLVYESIIFESNNSKNKKGNHNK